MQTGIVTVSQIDGRHIPPCSMHGREYSVYSVHMPRYHYTRCMCICTCRMVVHMRMDVHAIRRSCHIKYVMHAKGMACAIKECHECSGYLLREWWGCDLSHPALVQHSCHGGVVPDGGVVQELPSQALHTSSKTGNLLDKWQQHILRHYFGKDAAMVGLWLAAGRGGVVPLEDGDRATLTHRPAGSPQRVSVRCQGRGYEQNGLNNGPS